MTRLSTAALAVTLALTAGACMQQQNAQQLNITNSNSRIYIGALSCNIAGGTGYVLGSSKSMECVFVGRDGASAEYSGTINKVGIDIGYTKAVHTIWRVYSLGSDRKPDQIAGTYAGEQSTVVAAGSQAGGNWLYGGPNAEIGMVASGVTKDAGYNLATGVAEMTLKLK